MDEKLASNHHKCECCGRRTAKQRDGRWICRSCFTGEGDGMSNEEKRLQNSEPYHVRNKKHSQSDALVNDSGPIAGIGDSLIELEKRLDSIDADLYFQLNKDEGHAEL